MRRLNKKAEVPFWIWMIALLLSPGTNLAQNKTVQPEYLSSGNRPRLVVGIVIDQMRYEYIPLYWDRFRNDGFKQIVNEGYNFSNNHINYFSSATGPGHASIYTGTTPSVHGIVENQWYNRSTGEEQYVVSDTNVQTVGASNESGKMSPRNLLSTTLTDELKSFVKGSKVISISLKDRAAILPAGHLADGSYWLDIESGNYVTSTWYRKSLPEWVETFNDKKIAAKYSNLVWKPLLPINEYRESDADDSPYEGLFDGEAKAVFPHSMNGSIGNIRTSPFGNDLVAELSKLAIEGEHLGADSITDFLAMSFSATDFIGHRYGPHSIEVQDAYLRLDQTIADFLSFLNRKVGKGNYLLFLTADHGASDVPQRLVDRGLPGGYFDHRVVLDSLDHHLNAKYGSGNWISSYLNQMIYLNRPLIQKNQISLREMQNDIAEFLLGFSGVQSSNTAYNYVFSNYSNNLQALYQRGFYYDRSGDVYIQLKPGWLDSRGRRGASHGSPYNYDTHIPLLFYGWRVPRGMTNKRTYVTQIAPTICSMLHIMFPSGNMDEPLTFTE